MMGNAYAGKGPAPSDRVPSKTVDLQQEERKLEQIEQQASGTEKAQVSQGLVHTYIHKFCSTFSSPIATCLDPDDGTKGSL